LTAAESVCYRAAIRVDRQASRVSTSRSTGEGLLGNHRVIRPNDDSHNATTTLDLALNGAKRVKSFAFYWVPRIPT